MRKDRMRRLVTIPFISQVHKPDVDVCDGRRHDALFVLMSLPPTLQVKSLQLARWLKPLPAGVEPLFQVYISPITKHEAAAFSVFEKIFAAT